MNRTFVLDLQWTDRRRMNSEDVSRLIEHQIGDLGSLPNSHGVELHRCLTNPTLIQVTHRRVLNGKTKDSTEIVWLVLEERPDEKDGYKIIFNEKMRSFGLASAGWPSDRFPVICGYYGSFPAALAGM